ncbi:hypothetical protein JOD24_001658 [Kroppenstedtia sanguinis]|uniref:hypothetical protein n=1 Tax=Kroppenstedtia sanguinis TaxID=1380684 RepID=UPI003D1A615C
MEKSYPPQTNLDEQVIISSLRQLGFTVEKGGSKKTDQKRLFSAVIGKAKERLVLE